MERFDVRQCPDCGAVVTRIRTRGFVAVCDPLETRIAPDPNGYDVGYTSGGTEVRGRLVRFDSPKAAVRVYKRHYCRRAVSGKRRDYQ